MRTAFPRRGKLFELSISFPQIISDTTSLVDIVVVGDLLKEKYAESHLSIDYNITKGLEGERMCWVRVRAV